MGTSHFDVFSVLVAFGWLINSWWSINFLLIQVASGHTNITCFISVNVQQLSSYELPFVCLLLVTGVNFLSGVLRLQLCFQNYVYMGTIVIFWCQFLISYSFSSISYLLLSFMVCNFEVLIILVKLANQNLSLTFGCMNCFEVFCFHIFFLS